MFYRTQKMKNNTLKVTLSAPIIVLIILIVGMLIIFGYENTFIAKTTAHLPKHSNTAPELNVLLNSRHEKLYEQKDLINKNTLKLNHDTKIYSRQQNVNLLMDGARAQMVYISDDFNTLE